VNLRLQLRRLDASRQERLRRRSLGGYRYVRMRWRIVFGCLDGVGNLLFAMARFLFCWLPQRTTEGDPRRILLVQFDHLGDAILTTGMFGALKRRYPGARIDVLAAPWNRAVFDGVRDVDQVDVCRHNRFARGGRYTWHASTLAWGLRLRRRRYDLAIDVRGEFPHNVLLWLSGARRRLGWANGGGGFLLTDKAVFVANRPEAESRAALLGCLGIHRDGPLQPVFHVSRAAAETAEAAWSELNPTTGGVKIVVHVGAGTPAKRWPVEYWRTLLERLTTERHALVALVGTSRDGETARAILGAAPSADVVDWTGRFSVDELAATVQQADAFVGADSGPAHLAAAVGIPVVVLFSGTNTIEQWQPRGPSVRTVRCEVRCSPCHRKACPLAGHPCMRGIQPDDVMNHLTKLLPERLDAPLAAASSEN
jgi:heptosyltransferase-2